ncbi:MAG: hypothetical protein JNM65_20000 [Verrucomicrobiaceae bacterium]|nr:hypothetical protein [Verrucomicrobiaceae bacterium]
MNRRRFASAVIIPVIFPSACSRGNKLSHEDRVRLVAADKQWQPNEWREFMLGLEDSALVDLAIVYGSIRPNTPGISIKGEVLDATMALNYNSGRESLVNTMQEQAMNTFWSKLEKAGTVFTNPGYHVKWHEIVKRACFWAGLDGKEYDTKSSFEAEQALIKKLVAGAWDKLSQDQRREVVLKCEGLSNLTEAQKAAIITGSGGVLIATLSATILLSGFAFYTTMSSVLCASAGVLGITLPFGAYMGASSAAALVGGPVGWTVAALGIGAAIFVFFNDGDKEKLVKMVVATHLMKLRMLNDKL